MIRFVKVGDMVRYGNTEPSPVHTYCGRGHGFWYCIPHNKSFLDDADKEQHIVEGDHLFAWVCWTHWMEEPENASNT